MWIGYRLTPRYVPQDFFKVGNRMVLDHTGL